MNEIRPWLFIGKYTDLLNLETLQANGIGAMLELAGEVRQPTIDHKFIYIEDGEPLPPHKLAQGLEYIRQNKDNTVLVTCGAGISRASTFCIAALKEIEGLSLIEAYRTIRAVRPYVLPHPTLWQSLCEIYGEPFDYMQVLHASAS